MSSSEVYHHAKIIPTPEEIPLIIPDIKNPRFSYGGGKIGLGSLTAKELYEIGVQQVSGSNSVVHVVY